MRFLVELEGALKRSLPPPPPPAERRAAEGSGEAAGAAAAAAEATIERRRQRAAVAAAAGFDLNQGMSAGGTVCGLGTALIAELGAPPRAYAAAQQAVAAVRDALGGEGTAADERSARSRRRWRR